MQRRRADLQGIDIRAWPTVDPNAMPASGREVLAKRSRAVELYAEGVAAREIEKQTGVKIRQIYHLLNRCLAQDEDGAILGFRGLIKYKRIATYRRTLAAHATDPQTGHGLVGAFVLLLECQRHPNFPQNRRSNIPHLVLAVSSREAAQLRSFGGRPRRRAGAGSGASGGRVRICSGSS